MGNNRTKHFLKVGTLSALAAAVAVYGNSCGQFNTSDSLLNSTAALCVDAPVEFNLIQEAETASISYGKQVLESMVTCTGLKNLTQKTVDEYNNRQASLSKYGSVLDVNPPLIMAHTAIAIEVCDDLYQEEMSISPSQRRVFASLNDLGRAPSSIEISETLRRMARSCWGRDESAEELEIVEQELSQIINESNTELEAHRFGAISICTSVLASLEGYRM